MPGIGGMLTVIDAAGSGSSGDAVGPMTSGVTIDPTTGVLSASVSDAATGGASVAAAEYFIDTAGAPGTGTPMTGSFPSDPAAVTATVAVGSLTSGTHTVFVRGQDGLGQLGRDASVVFSLDTVGPATTGALLTPTAGNGTASVEPDGHGQRSGRQVARTSRPPSTSSTSSVPSGAARP